MTFWRNHIIELRMARSLGTVGLTWGASAPEVLVEEVIAWFRERGTTTVDTVMVVDEDVEFAMPSNLARRLQERGLEAHGAGGEAPSEAVRVEGADLARS